MNIHVLDFANPEDKMNALRALGGAPLKGEKLVRFVYLDETGTGDPARDEFVIVAGVIVNADKQWKAIEAHLRSMADAFALPEDRDGFVFHASELYSGGKVVTREKYPKEKRHQALAQLCDIPSTFGLPVVYFPVNRLAMAIHAPELDATMIVESAQLIASQGCALQVEFFMREFSEEDEVATLVYEEAGRLGKFIRKNHNFMQHPDSARAIEFEDLVGMLPVQRIIDTAHFAGKSDTSILQVSDACAFAIRRDLQAMQDAEMFYPQVEKQIIHKIKLVVSSELASVTQSAS